MNTDMSGERVSVFICAHLWIARSFA